jgi:hypothetical protein
VGRASRSCSMDTSGTPTRWFDVDHAGRAPPDAARDDVLGGKLVGYGYQWWIPTSGAATISPASASSGMSLRI